MMEMDIVCFYPGPNLSKRAKAAKTYPYLLRNLEINQPNQVWSIDDYFTLRVPPVHANDTGSTWDDTIGSQNDTGNTGIP